MYKKLFILYLIVEAFIYTPSFSQNKVVTMKIDNVIDSRMNRYVELALDYAEEKKADVVIIEMDTYGGAVTDADGIRTRILESKIPIWVLSIKMRLLQGL